MVVLLFLCCYQCNYWKSYIELDILLINQERSLQGILRPMYCIAQSIHQGWCPRFPCNDRINKVNKFFIIWPFIMDLSLRSIKINNWSADNFKKNTYTQHLNELSLEPAYSQVTLASGWSFWQLSFDYNMDVRKDVHYQFKHKFCMPCTPS